MHQRSQFIHYGNYTDHYALDAFDMPLPEDLGFFRRNQDRRRFEVVARMVPRAGTRRVLDAGTGSGWLGEMLFRRGFDVCALDLGGDSLQRAARRARNRGIGIRFAQGDIYQLPYPDRCFDVVTACEILEHLDRPGEALREMARVLRPGGCAIVSTPCRERIEMTLCIHCNRKTPVNAHLHSFDERSLSELVESAGLSVREIFPFINRPVERFGFAGLSSFLPHMLWRAADTVLCRVFGHESYLAVKAVRNA
jgi:SAM-dependent methyltransferase